MDALAPPNCCYECKHPFAEHGDPDGCVRFVHDPAGMLVRCGCTDKYVLAQAEHERRQAADPNHDYGSRGWCCPGCDDLDLGMMKE